MNVLLVSATINEVSPLLGNNVTNVNRGLNTKVSLINTLQVDLLITGVGSMATTFHLTDVLNKMNYDLVLQVGICGTFDRNIQIGEVVEIITETISQTGAEDDSKFISIFEMGLEDKNAFPFLNGKLINQNPLNLENVRHVESITVETAHGNETTIARTLKQYNAAVENMEGAALFYCCLMKNTRFAELRAISNYIEKRNKANWNIAFAVENLNLFLSNFLKRIKA
ncbi:MAG: futalosine hydrolase [Chitinophagales bacterium]